MGGKGDLMDYNRNLFVMDLQAACITLGCDFDPAAHTEAEIDQLYELWDKERLPMLEFAQKYICGLSGGGWQNRACGTIWSWLGR